jgi:hypothetical protein
MEPPILKLSGADVSSISSSAAQQPQKYTAHTHDPTTTVGSQQWRRRRRVIGLGAQEPRRRLTQAATGERHSRVGDPRRGAQSGGPASASAGHNSRRGRHSEREKKRGRGGGPWGRVAGDEWRRALRRVEASESFYKEYIYIYTR